MSDDPSNEKILRVSGGTDCKKLAYAISGLLEKDQPCVLEFIGAGASNQATKSVIIANGICARHGFTVSVDMRFVSRVVGGDKLSAVQYRFIKRMVC